MATAVVWFRRDLRVHDNAALADAVAAHDEVVPLYVLPDRLRGTGRFGLERVGPYRARFLAESLADLRESLRAAGGDLLVREGDPAAIVPRIAAEFGADAVYHGYQPGTEEEREAAAVEDALADRGVRSVVRRTGSLYHPADLPDPPARIDDTFTPWRQSVEAAAEVREPRSAPDRVPTPEAEAGDLPTVATFGHDDADATVDERSVLEWTGGETAGLGRLETYVWTRDRLRSYKETRNGLLGADYSSKLSPWLALGCLSPRRVAAEIDRYEDERVENDSTYWLRFELTWRDFFRFQFEKHGAAFFRPEGIRGREIDWRGTDEQFERWAAGETGIPFVDATVRELNWSGYVSNRGRQNAASFLANNLRVDWRLGAAYYEARLVDYDVASNWGNWAYIAGVGNDSRNRHFDVLSQARKYDADADYVRRWVPELADLPPEYAHEPWEMGEEEARRYGVELGVDYPRPMIDLAASYERLP